MDKYFENLPVAITVTGKDFRIVDMNRRSAEVNNHGSKSIVGNDLMHCHNERSQDIIRHIAASREPNVYTVEKTNTDGRQVKKLIYQSPWYDSDGSYGGLIELSLEIPFDMPHYVRKPKSE